MGYPIQDCFGLTASANPITYINDNNEPLMHIFHANRDPLVPLGQSELFYEALAQAGNEVWFTSVSDPNGFHDHAIIIGASEYTVYLDQPRRPGGGLECP